MTKASKLTDRVPGLSCRGSAWLDGRRIDLLGAWRDRNRNLAPL